MFSFQPRPLPRLRTMRWSGFASELCERVLRLWTLTFVKTSCEQSSTRRWPEKCASCLWWLMCTTWCIALVVRPGVSRVTRGAMTRYVALPLREADVTGTRRQRVTAQDPSSPFSRYGRWGHHRGSYLAISSDDESSCVSYKLRLIPSEMDRKPLYGKLFNAMTFVYTLTFKTVTTTTSSSPSLLSSLLTVPMYLKV